MPEDMKAQSKISPSMRNMSNGQARTTLKDILLRSILFGLPFLVTVSLSLTISSVTKNSLTNARANDKAQDSQQGQQGLTTQAPSLLPTTASQYSFFDSIPSRSQDSLKHSSYKTANLSSLEYSRSNFDDSDDSLPLATINNHSGNNNNNLSLQSPARPAQYVDVSALVGRNSDTNLSAVASPSLGLASNSSNGLSAKSRSGLPECATQQVCNAIFVRMNYTQRLCECSSNFNWKCSHTQDPQDGHTIELTRRFDKRIYTQIKTCEPLREVRACKSPTDWTLLALQSERSGKAHYVVVCKCPTWAQLEGPYTHNHPPYANIPGIRVYGMLCAHQTARSSAQTYNPSLSAYPEFPWSEALSVANTTNLLTTLDAH